jgi:hypothetical protein
VHYHTTVPVPKVLAWNADPSNPVGAEYIIMEKAAGCQLVKKWGEMEDLSHFEFIKTYVRLKLTSRRLHSRRMEVFTSVIQWGPATSTNLWRPRWTLLDSFASGLLVSGRGSARTKRNLYKPASTEGHVSNTEPTLFPN